MNRHEIASVLKAQGWTEDRYGNLKSRSGIVRVKFQICVGLWAAGKVGDV